MVRLNAKEFLTDLLDTGCPKEEALIELKKEIAKRKAACVKGEKFYNDHTLKEKQNCINFK